MWLPTLLSACGDAPIPATTVTGLQVVAIGADPAQPSPLQDLTLEVWVADGLGTGADVVVWMCSLVDGRCLEFDALEGSDGLPLQFVTKVGAADPVFRATVAWPLLADLALDSLAVGAGAIDDDLAPGTAGLLVWALACVPGVCDVIRQVRADPIAGSPTWWDATDALADPATILDGVPPGEASVAVKFVPVWRGPVFGTEGTFANPNLPPSLALVSRTASPPTAQLSFFDPDGDEVSIQAFTTVGGALLTRPGPNEARLAVIPSTGAIRRAPRDLRWDGGGGDWFVVAEDGRGGTAVWSSTAAQQGRCAPEVTLPTGPSPGDRWDVAAFPSAVTPRLRGFPRGADTQVFLTARDGSVSWSGFSSFAPGYPTTTTGGASSQPIDPCTPVPQTIPLFSYDLVDLCALGGTPLDLRVVAQDRDGLRASIEVPLIAATPSLFCP